MKRLNTLLLSLAALIAQVAQADTPSPLSLSGFGTLGAARTDNANRAFRSNSVSDSGAGAAFDLSVDSVLGVQGSLQLCNRLDLTVQSVVRKSPTGSYDPRITWAFASYQATPELLLRIGRTRLPFFMYSDSLNLNYANPWIRPPVEVYSLNPLSDIDGADALYRRQFADTDVELHAYTGSSAMNIRGGSANLDKIRGLKASFSRRGLTAQISYARADMSLRWSDAYFLSLRQALIATGHDAIVPELSGTDGKTSFMSAALQYDQDRLLLIAEIARRNVDRYIDTALGWYVTAGYRTGAFMPYLTLARQREVSPVSTAATGVAVLDDGLAAFNAGRNKAQRSIGAGLRWDAGRNVAVKAQFERIQPGPGGLGILLPNQLTDYLKPDGPTYVLSLAVDFVF
ncbi:MAG: hypothetical protein JSR83_05075 [Proteobacteria bacterium]|nr:hypothetical protein [Pseudomonadota bacterium]